ncbi:hypothetical protein jhhlp_000572 [Lomentospora prolificans]|uniref:5'-3' DNA helicase ZGRF1-like N-terminal domain-containing protein n=1 Tax=Lomentospora prolificans TaxID=41688 RepID=A0A2N3NL94_9PEZI|nr:hypothetical protein jhhlp_000572 [Lomentospora prolificans]
MIPATTCTSKTAPVLDFSCLFTHDLKRKQKRWQDGRLTFHAFNRRVMVYDERGNFIGDTHWRGADEIYDGDEVELDRGGVIVQVSEFLGKKEQDLSKIFAKRARSAGQVIDLRTSSGVQDVNQSHSPNSRSHRLPLSSIVSTTGRQLGRAVIPTTSPFQQRQVCRLQPTQFVDTDSQKRRKLDCTEARKSSYATSLFGASLNLSRQASSPVLTKDRGLPDAASSNVFTIVSEEQQSSAMPPARMSSFGRSASAVDRGVTSKGPRIGSHAADELGVQQRHLRQKAVSSGNTSRPGRKNPTSASEGTTINSQHNQWRDLQESGSSVLGHSIAGGTPLDRTTSRGLGLKAAKDIPGVSAANNKGSQMQRDSTEIGPTTELRLPTFQRRGLLVAKRSSLKTAMTRTPPTPASKSLETESLCSSDTTSKRRLVRSDHEFSSMLGPWQSNPEGDIVADRVAPVLSERADNPLHDSSLCNPSTRGIGGGPWSREAFDLLDQGRPTRKSCP